MRNLMAKGFDGQGMFVETLFVLVPHGKEKVMKKPAKKQKKDVIAYRKSCKATGTGLSHYILMDKKAK